MLLNFAEHNSGADGVHGAGGNENGVARNQRDAIEAIFGRAVGDGALETFASDARLQPDEHFRAGRARTAYHISVLPRPPAACS